MMIEQAQIITTQNLAALVVAGALPRRPWGELAGDAFAQMRALLLLAPRQRRGLPTVKNAAYAWRQGLFYLSMVDRTTAQTVLREGAAEPGTAAIGRVFEDALLVAGGSPQGVRPGFRPFLGWSVGGHPVLEELRAEARR